MTRSRWIWAARAVVYAGLAFAAFSIVAVLPPVLAQRVKMTAESWKALGVELGEWDAERATPNVSPLDPFMRLRPYGTPLEGASVDFAQVRDPGELVRRFDRLGTVPSMLISRAKATDAETVAALLATGSVKMVQFDRCELTAATLPATGLQSLEWIHTNECRLQPEFFLAVARLSRLQSVHFAGNAIDDAALSTLFASPSLTHLLFHRCDLSRCRDRDLPGSLTLLGLWFSESDPPVALDAWVPRCAKLERLGVGRIDRVRVDPVAIMRTPSLRMLSVDVGDDAGWLAGLPNDANLTELFVGGRVITEASGAELATRLPRLKTLSLDGPGLDDRAADRLEASFPHLKVHCFDSSAPRPRPR